MLIYITVIHIPQQMYSAGYIREEEKYGVHERKNQQMGNSGESMGGIGGKEGIIHC